MLRYCCRFEDFLIAKRFSIRRRGIPTISIIILITHLIIIDSLQYFKVQFRSSHQHHEVLYLHDLGLCHRRWRYINRLLFSNFATGTRILTSHQVSPSIASTRATPHFLSLITKLDFPSSWEIMIQLSSDNHFSVMQLLETSSIFQPSWPLLLSKGQTAISQRRSLP